MPAQAGIQAFGAHISGFPLQFIPNLIRGGNDEGWLEKLPNPSGMQNKLYN